MKILPIISACALLGLACGAFAAGGQNQTQNPIFGDNCVETVPPGIDPSSCEEMPAPPQSGVQVFFCESTRVIICSDAEIEADD